MVLNPNYKPRNLVALNVAGFMCISVVVFLLSSQPFFLSEVVGVAPEKTGATVGLLGTLDELTSVAVLPFIGTLTDKLNGVAWRGKYPSGPRVLELCGFLLLALAMVGYGRLTWHVFPELWLWRAVFALAVTGIMNTVTVMLHEANNSDLDFTDFLFWRKKQTYAPLGAEAELEGVQSAGIQSEVGEEYPAETERGFGDEMEQDFQVAPPRKRHGKLAALLGVCTGLGAVFSLAVFLTMPVKLSHAFPSLSSKDSLRWLYTILGLYAVAAAVLVSFFAYDCVRERRENHSEELPKGSYFQLLRDGIAALRHNRRVQLAYVAGFVSRSTTVGTAVFIPLMVYKFYFSEGKCGAGTFTQPLKNECYNGYVFSAIVTGVAQTVALVSSPVWGILVDLHRLGSLAALFVASVCGMIGTFGLCLLGGKGVFDPRNAGTFVFVSFMGLSQIGTIISSMSLLSSVGATEGNNDHRVIGSISGLSLLCGGAGILFITAVGGRWSDEWVFAPFFILGCFNAVLAAASIYSSRATVLGEVME